uniref:S-layer homology domain-containing protein n=1 Tax=Paenibacillus zanthoxyli TaxID=369399 RepID=UPI00047076D4
MKKTAIFLTVFLIAAILAPASPHANAAGPMLFSDISPTHWAQKEISRLKEQQLIGGYSDGTFRPDKPITRGEAVKLVVRASHIPVEANANPQQAPPDVPRAYWAYPYIQAAMKHGLITGYLDGSFRPGDTLTRADSAVLIARAFELNSPGTDAASRVSDIGG